MVNLLEETLQCLKENTKEESDVLWVGMADEYYSSWEDFKNKADFEYNNGYGCEEIPTRLIVVGKDFWLERHEYDGAEWWAFKTMPQKPKEEGELVL